MMFSVELILFLLHLPTCMLFPTAHNASICLPDTVTISVEAINLSEDMSTLSSKNDELLVLIYDYRDSTKLSKPLASEYFVLDSAHRKHELTFNSNPIENVLFLLLEVDSNKSPDQIEKYFRRHFKEILQLFTEKNRVELEKHLDDEDLMGSRFINFNEGESSVMFTFQGRYKLDKFHYRVEIQK